MCVGWAALTLEELKMIKIVRVGCVGLGYARLRVKIKSCYLHDLRRCFLAAG